MLDGIGIITMTREYKFRVLYDIPTQEDAYHKIPYTPHWHYFEVCSTIDWFRCKNAEETIGQYTGRKDKNNDELYKDDIVQWMDDNLKLETGIIEWDEEYAGWGISGGHCLDWSHAIEKIGNRHQNPELLTG